VNQGLIRFDPDKDRTNREKHGIGLSDFAGFDGELRPIRDMRADYGEVRYRAFGTIDGLGYMIAFTLQRDHIRLISFRRAREKEIRRYGG
jgi:hypothetical protein